MAQAKIIQTALDQLPYGSPEDRPQSKQRKLPLPEGVSRKQMIRDVLIIAWPSLVELILTQLTSMADQIMVGRLPGEAGIAALSAVGLAAQPKFLLMTMIMSLNVGATAVIARYRGQQNQEKARQAFRQTVLLNLLVGLFFMCIGLAFAPQLIRFMSGEGISEQTLNLATEYLDIQMYGFLPLVMGFTITAALRGIGDSKTPMVYNTVANVVNVIMNYALIYGKFGFPAMGVAGASWATVIGQTIASFMAIYVVFSGKNYIFFDFRKITQFDKSMLSNVISIGFPAMVEQLFMRAGVIVFTRAVAGLGDTMYATHQICMSIQAFSFMMGQAFASSATTLMGQSLGKCRYDMAVNYMKQTRQLGFYVSVLLGILIIIFREPIVAIYNENPDVIHAGSSIMVVIALSQPIQAAQFIVSGGLRGAGDTKYTAFVILITTLGVRSILAVLLVNILQWGLWGAWIALMADQCLRSALMIHRYNSCKWMEIWGQTRGAKKA